MDDPRKINTIPPHSTGVFGGAICLESERIMPIAKGAGRAQNRPQVWHPSATLRVLKTPSILLVCWKDSQSFLRAVIPRAKDMLRSVKGIHLLTKGYQLSPEAGRETWKRFSPRRTSRNQTCPHLPFWHLTSIGLFSMDFCSNGDA